MLPATTGTCPVMLILIAALVEACRKQQVLAWILTPFALLCVYLNIWYTVNSHPSGTLWPGGKPLLERSLVDTDVMSWEYLKKVVGRWHVPEEYEKLKEAHEIFEGTPQQMKLLYTNDFEQDTAGTCIWPGSEHNHAVCLSKENQNSPRYETALAGSTQWVRIQALFHCEAKEWNRWKMAQFNADVRRNGETVKSSLYRIYRFLNDGDTKTLWLDVRLPKPDCDSLWVNFWNADSDKPLYIDSLRVYSFNRPRA